MSTRTTLSATAVLVTLTLVLIAAGCAGRPSMLPNSDKTLRKSSAEFAADAAKRFPYKADAPRGGEAVARAQVDYTFDRVEVANLSDEHWASTEIWVNQKYVVGLPQMEKGKLKVINFQMLYDEQGKYFPTGGRKSRVEKIELLRDGQMYDVPLQLRE